jgi:hypothetical protein
MKTSWKVRSMTTRTTLPDGSTAASSGPTIASQALGKYFEDYEYSSGYGDLDQYNGRTCVTPEYPSGTYAYFITKDASGNPEFPYIIGDYFYGVRELGNMGPTAGNNTVPTGATLYSSTALPIELTHFEAVTKDCDVQLKWSSAIETNFDYFEIEYSDNAKDFQAIGKIAAKGNDSRYTFSYNPLDGVSYYRLKMVDKDGSVEYSKIIANQLQCGLKNIKIDVYPNPVANELSIDLQSNTQHKIFIYDISGKIIYNAFANDVTKIDFSSYPSGSYVVEIINNDTGNGLMKKIIKQ